MSLDVRKLIFQIFGGNPQNITIEERAKLHSFVFTQDNRTEHDYFECLPRVLIKYPNTILGIHKLEIYI